jgi:hypothetical protein
LDNKLPFAFAGGRESLRPEGSSLTAAKFISLPSQPASCTSITGQMLQELPGVQENEGLDQLALQIPGVTQTRHSNFSNTNGAAFVVNGISRPQ